LPKLLPALFLKKPRYPCPFEILEETLIGEHFKMFDSKDNLFSIFFKKSSTSFSGAYRSYWSPILDPKINFIQ
jgi:hypothetical protein